MKMSPPAAGAAAWAWAVEMSIGLSGSEQELAQVWNGYGVFRQKVEGTSAAGYLVDHTARVTVIDQDGNLRVSYPFDASVENIVHDLKILLN